MFFLSRVHLFKQKKKVFGIVESGFYIKFGESKPISYYYKEKDRSTKKEKHFFVVERIVCNVIVEVFLFCNRNAAVPEVYTTLTRHHHS